MKPLPVTVFLSHGAENSRLPNHVIPTREGMKAAAMVNGVSMINVDAQRMGGVPQHSAEPSGSSSRRPTVVPEVNP